jgi:hypothetical protein
VLKKDTEDVGWWQQPVEEALLEDLAIEWGK